MDAPDQVNGSPAAHSVEKAKEEDRQIEADAPSIEPASTESPTDLALLLKDALKEKADLSARLKELEDDVIPTLLDDIESLRAALTSAEQRSLSVSDFGLVVGERSFSSPSEAWAALDERGKQGISISFAALFRQDVIGWYVSVTLSGLGTIMMDPEGHAQQIQGLLSLYERAQKSSGA